ncbi:MAG: histidinol phosphatase, partial [Dehalococcoidia bacterium]
VEVDGRIEAGVASAPALGTRWWAGRGLGAYRGATGIRSHAGERIHVSPVARLDAAQVLYGSWRYQADRWPGFETLVRSAWRSRGYGDFWQHCLVAEGAAEVALEGDISPWDIAALVVILEEAGGRLTDDRGVPTIDAGHCVTSNGALHEETLRVLLGGGAATGAGW